MDPNKMTGETSRQNPSSVFGFDPYPPPYQVNWNQTNPFGNPTTQFNAVLQSPVCAQSSTNFPAFSIQAPVTNISPSISQQITSIPQVSPQLDPYVGNVNQPISPTRNPNDVFGSTSFTTTQNNFSFGGPKPTQDVIQFPFQVSGNGFGHRCKRKTDSPPLQPVKQHITEEKMAEHMSKLHINSETPVKSESESCKIQRLYMCEEMRKLQTDSIIPESLITNIPRPCTALVLWKPPSRLLPPLSPSDENQNENNNQERVPDAMENEADMEPVASNMDMESY